MISVPENNDQSEENGTTFLRLYRVPLEHFPSLENYYPERAPSVLDDSESIVDVKHSKTTALQAKKIVAPVEIDKTSILFDEKIKEMFRTR